MANYNLVVNSRFKPFSLQELWMPAMEATKAHQALEEAYTNLGMQAGTVEAMLNKELDRDAYNQYQGYMQGLKESADMLATQGLNPSLRGSLGNLRTRYSQEIVPIQAAAQRRERLAEEQRKLGPGYAFEYDASTTGLDKFMNNPTFTPKQINLAEIRQRSAAEFGTLAKQLRSFKENPNMYRKGFDSTVLAEYGYSPEDAARVAESIRRGEVSPEDAAASAIYNSIYGSTGVDSWSNNLNIGQQAVRNAIAEGVVGAIGQMAPQIVTDKLAYENYQQQNRVTLENLRYQHELDKLREKANIAGNEEGSNFVLESLPAKANQSKDQRKLYNKISRYRELLDIIKKNPSILEAQGNGDPYVQTGDLVMSADSYNPNVALRKEFEELQKDLLEAASRSYPDARIYSNARVRTAPQTITLPYSNVPLSYNQKQLDYSSNLEDYLDNLATISRGYRFKVDPAALENIMGGLVPDYRNYITDDKGHTISNKVANEIAGKDGDGWKNIVPYIEDGKFKFNYKNQEYVFQPGAFGTVDARWWNAGEGPGLTNLWNTQQYDLFNKYIYDWANDLYLHYNTMPVGQSHTGKVDVGVFHAYGGSLDNPKGRLQYKGRKYNWNGISTTGNRPYNSEYFDRIVNGLYDSGYNDNQIATIIGTMIEEGQGNPLAKSSTGKYRGLLQWDDTRYNDFDEKDSPDLQWAKQMNYLNRTLRNSKGGNDWNKGKDTGWDTYKTPYNMFWGNESSLDDVAKGFQLGYVRPKGGIDSHNNRLKVIQQVHKILTEGE